eukprot:1339039-Pleurochrysis_carterae.AAC.4
MLRRITVRVALPSCINLVCILTPPATLHSCCSFSRIPTTSSLRPSSSMQYPMRVFLSFCAFKQRPVRAQTSWTVTQTSLSHMVRVERRVGAAQLRST